MQRTHQMILAAAGVVVLALATILLGPSTSTTAAVAEIAPVEMAGYSFFNGVLIESDYVISDEARTSAPRWEPLYICKTMPSNCGCLRHVRPNRG